MNQTTYHYSTPSSASLWTATARSLTWPILITLSALAAVWVVLAEVGPPLQPVILLWFLLVCPGLAFVRLLRLDDWFAQCTLAIAVSTALGVVLAEGMIYSHRWNPIGALLVLAALSIIGAALDAIMTARYQPRSSSPTEDSMSQRSPDQDCRR